MKESDRFKTELLNTVSGSPFAGTLNVEETLKAYEQNNKTEETG
jgi:hypothetical protein